MPTSNKHSVSGQELDNLLKQAFLNLDVTNPKNDTMMETVANTIFTQPVPPLSGATGKSFFTFKTLFLGIGLLTLIAVAIYFFGLKTGVEEKNKTTNHTSDPVTQVDQQADQPRVSSVPEKYNSKKMALQQSAEVIPDAVPSVAPDTRSVTGNGWYRQGPKYTAYNQEPNAKPQDSAYVFPVLTEAEMLANGKRKEKMLIQVIKLSSSKYAYIPSGNVKSSYYKARGATLLYMQKTEVSNIEYKTFLFDLLIHGNYAGFLKAKPEQTLWKTIDYKKTGVYFEDLYFSDKAYNDYPVVNVSREGVELYCKWLKEESQWLAEEKKMLKEEDRDRLYLRSYGLPTAKDWAYAAEGGEAGNIYPWKGSFMRNAKGAYLANFCIRKEERAGAVSSSSDYTSASVGLDGAKDLLTCRVDGFKPNEFDLYNMSGNVAEFVVDDSTGQLLAKGGSWNSSPEELKITGREAITGDGASPYHGFRPTITIGFLSLGSMQQPVDSSSFYTAFNPVVHYPVVKSPVITSPVITYPPKYPVVADDSAYVFPVLTEAEIKANHKQKKLMIEQVMKLHKDRYAYIPMGSFLYGKDTFSCRAFYMQTTEVSNLEYRTFLFDLLIAGKKQEFLKAKPDQEQWNKKFGKDGYFDPMKQMYFSHPAYDDYPVVNISREGAEMYCIWLSVATNERLKEKGKPLMNDLRLPSDYEWAYAASNKLMYARYANGTPNLRNSKGLYLQNYNCDTYANSRYDSLHDVFLFHKTEEGKGPVTDGGFFTTVKKAYAPNAYGIYDLAGNVSEMVYLWDGRTNKAKGFGTKGGSWCSPDYFLEIDARQEFRKPEKPSPLVGFRPVMTALTGK